MHQPLSYCRRHICWDTTCHLTFVPPPLPHPSAKNSHRRQSITDNTDATPSKLSVPSPPSYLHFYTECPFCHNPPNFSWLGTSSKYCWLAYPVAWFGFSHARTHARTHTHTHTHTHCTVAVPVMSRQLRWLGEELQHPQPESTISCCHCHATCSNTSSLGQQWTTFAKGGKEPCSQ